MLRINEKTYFLYVNPWFLANPNCGMLQLVNLECQEISGEGLLKTPHITVTESRFQDNI
jgi:hypothetical protein